MALLFRNIKNKFLELIPLFLLFFISLSGNSIVDVVFFSINVNYILIYFWVLRRPQILGYGFIFLSGIISDVVFGLPVGATPLALLLLAAAATYVRLVTVRVSLLNDWISFIPALLLANFVYYISLYYSDYSIDYLYLFSNSIFTFIFYPALWIIFSILLNLMKS
tara:strand:+ start:689 stop:1183 length:495 start_codon:yes stop_codon:yes gene_type:complete